MYLFTGKLASRRVSDLSGGEKARLVLAELLQSRPNFLVLDEPTNHMDVQAKHWNRRVSGLSGTHSCLCPTTGILSARWHRAC
ncbi:MAG: ATP-binding cassette domain-containing protein [Clostridium sp.]